MLDSVFFLISEFLAVQDILNLRVIDKSTLIQSKEITNLKWSLNVNVPIIFTIFPKLRNVTLGSCAEQRDMRLIDLMDWFLSREKLLRLELVGVRITECLPEYATRLYTLHPPLVSLQLHQVTIPNSYLCYILLGMPRISSLHISKCPNFDGRAANLILSQLKSLKIVLLNELFEIKDVDYSLSSARIAELTIQKCPRLLAIKPNCYLLKCQISQSSITGKTIESIVEVSSCLHELVIEECRNVQVVNIQSASLVKLRLARCMLLRHVGVNAAALLDLSVSQCQRLSLVDIDAPLLRGIKLPHLSALNELYVTSAELRRLDLTGCLCLYQSILAIGRTMCAAQSPHNFAVSRSCMIGGRSECTPPAHNHSHFCSDDHDGMNASSMSPELLSLSEQQGKRKSHRRCFHHDRISLCCPRLRIKDSTLVFPMPPVEVEKEVPQSGGRDRDEQKARRGSL